VSGLSGLGGTGSAGELLGPLADALPRVVPEQLLEIERQRSLGERLSGKPGRVVQVRITGPDLILSLRSEDGQRSQAQAWREVRGVVISRRTVTLMEWLELMAGQLHALAAESASDESALSRTLSALGVREPASDLVVAPADIPGGLRALPGRLAGRVPDDVIATVERIVALLSDTLPRVAGDGSSAQAHTVSRAATDYLPRTLRGYAALPPDWAATHDLGGGRTALDALREQLAVLETSLSAMRDAAAGRDAEQLLANGLFLRDRFGRSELDAPELDAPE